MAGRRCLHANGCWPGRLAVPGHAARDAGLRLTLLDTCYLSGGLECGAHVPLSPRQARFGDGDADRWARRFEGLNADHSTVIGAAIHSVRAVPSEQIPVVVQAAQGRPLHAHLSEQLAENAACEEAYGLTPTGVLARAGALGPMTTVVHATHLTGADIGLLGSTRTSTCFCPTTERDLADGIGPAMELSEAGSPLCLGSDQNAIIDLLEEARSLEMHERLQARRKELGILQRDLVEQLGLKTTELSEYERGRDGTTHDVLWSWAGALRWSVVLVDMEAVL